MHKVLAPSQLAIAKSLAGQGSVGDMGNRLPSISAETWQAVHDDVTTLISAGGPDRTETRVEFPQDQLHFKYYLKAVA